MTKRKTNRADVSEQTIAIGDRLRQARMRKGWSQGQLGEVLGVSFQQVQKYEKGTNRVSSAALVQLCNALGVTVESIIGGQGSKVHDTPLSLSAMKCAIAIDKLPEKLHGTFRDLAVSMFEQLPKRVQQQAGA